MNKKRKIQVTVLFYQIMIGLKVGRSSALGVFVNKKNAQSEKSAAYNPIHEPSRRSTQDSSCWLISERPENVSSIRLSQSSNPDPSSWFLLVNPRIGIVNDHQGEQILDFHQTGLDHQRQQVLDFHQMGLDHQRQKILDFHQMGPDHQGQKILD